MKKEDETLTSLRGERIFLRPVEIEDLEALYRWENDISNWVYSNHLNPFSRFYLEQYILNSDNNIYNDKQLRLMIVGHDNAARGIIDLFDFDPHHRRVAIGIIIDPGYQKQGFASEALELVITYAREILHCKQVYCGIDADNEVSLKLFQKFGFKITGTKKMWRLLKGGWRDEHFLQLIF